MTAQFLNQKVLAHPATGTRSGFFVVVVVFRQDLQGNVNLSGARLLGLVEVEQRGKSHSVNYGAGEQVTKPLAARMTEWNGRPLQTLWVARGQMSASFELPSEST